MGIFNKGKNIIQQTALNFSGASNSTEAESYSLLPLKKAVELNVDDCKSLKIIKENDGKISELQKKSFIVNKNLRGNNFFYKNVVIFNNTIDNMTKTLTNEVFSDLKVVNIKGEEINRVEYPDIVDFINININTFKEIFYNLYLYSQILVVKYENDFIIYLPFQYYIEHGVIYIIDTGREQYVGVVQQFTILNFDNSFYDKLETVLTYDLMNSVLVKEAVLNQSKIFLDKKLYSKNVVYDELLNLVDVPKNETLGTENDKSKYIDSFVGKNSLNDLVNTKREVEYNLVNAFKLSKKTLGIDSGGQDFASSLPYENDMTAKTVNNLRDIMKVMLEDLIYSFTNIPVIFDFKRYQLTSYESIIEINSKALKTKQMSIEMAVSKSLDKPTSDPEVVKEVLTIKIEHSTPLNAEEKVKAEELGLLENNNSNNKISSVTDDKKVTLQKTKVITE